MAKSKLLDTMRQAIDAVRPAETLDLHGRVVLITGGSRGLGIAIAREMARRGAKLALLARDEAELRAAHRELSASGTEVLPLIADVTDPACASQVVARTLARFERIDVLVNDAGIIEFGPLEEMTEDDYSTTMATHFGGPLRLIREVVPHMIAAGGGRIVNIASLGGLIPVPHLGPYCASKFALVGLSESLRVELAKDRVHVTTVCPGLMRTGSGVAAYFKGRVGIESLLFRASSVLPLFSMSADQAAREIADACVAGDGLVVLGTPAKVGAFAYHLAPTFIGKIMALGAALLPSPPEIRTHEKTRGVDIPLASEWIEKIERRYVVENNEPSATTVAH